MISFWNFFKLLLLYSNLIRRSRSIVHANRIAWWVDWHLKFGHCVLVCYHPRKARPSISCQNLWHVCSYITYIVSIMSLITRQKLKKSIYSCRLRSTNPWTYIYKIDGTNTSYQAESMSTLLLPKGGIMTIICNC